MDLEDIFASERFIWFSSEELQRMIDLYLSGKTTYELSSIFGIDPRAVGRRLVAMGAELRIRGRKPMFTDDECVEIFEAKQAQSKTIAQIAREINRSERTVCEYIFIAKAAKKREQQARQ